MKIIDSTLELEPITSESGELSDKIKLVYFNRLIERGNYDLFNRFTFNEFVYCLEAFSSMDINADLRPAVIQAYLYEFLKFDSSFYEDIKYKSLLDKVKNLSDAEAYALVIAAYRLRASIGESEECNLIERLKELSYAKSLFLTETED